MNYISDRLSVSTHICLSLSVIGISAKFFTSLALLILRHADNLSKTLQKKDISAAEGQVVIVMTNSTLKAIRTDDAFASFWMRVTATADELNVPQPALPCRHKMPRHYDEGSAPSFPLTAELPCHLFSGS